MKDLKRPIEPFRPVRRIRIQKRSANPDYSPTCSTYPLLGGVARTRSSAHRNRLRNIRRTAHAAVDEQCKLGIREVQPPRGPKMCNDFRKDLESRTCKVKLPSPMVRKHNPCEAAVVCFESIL